MFDHSFQGGFRGEHIVLIGGIFRRACATTNAYHVGIDNVQKFVVGGGITAVVSALEQFAMRKIVHFHEFFLSVLLEISREEVMLISVGDKHAYRIIVLVARSIVIIITVENGHRYVFTELINLLRSVFPSYTFCGGIVLCARFDLCGSRRTIIGIRGALGVRQSEIYYRLAFVLGEYSRFARKRSYMILVRVRCDNVFQYAVVAILIHVVFDSGGATRTTARVDQYFNATAIEKDGIARVIIAQFQEMNAEFSAPYRARAGRTRRRRGLGIIDGRRAFLGC